MKILGIDPGASGGAVLLEGNAVIGIHKFVGEDEYMDVIKWCAEQGTDAAFIEQVHAAPGQGVSSMFKFGDNFGFERGIVRMAGIPLHRVTPQKWQRGLNLPKAASKTAHKNNLKNRASELYPNEKWILATADAVLIARYGLNSFSRTAAES